MGDERRINQLTAKAYYNIGSSDYFAVDNASEAESKKLPASSIKTPISNLQGEVTGGSDTYSSTKNYSVGMYATHTTGGVQKLYRCKTACTAASWTTNASCFEEANLADAVSALNNDLKANTFDAIIGPISNPTSEYTAPSDGYYRSLLYTAATSNDYISIAINGTVISRVFGHPGGIATDCVFVRKGMKCKIVTSNANVAEADFYPIHQT